MNKKVLGIILVLFTLISLTVGGYFFFNSPKIKFAHLVNTEYKSFVEILDNIRNSELMQLSQNSSIVADVNVSFDVSINEELFGDSFDKVIDVINNLNTNIKYGADNVNDRGYIKFDSNINNNDFLDVEFYQINDKNYLYFNDIYDKYIESDSITINANQDGQADDTIYLIEKIKKSFVFALETAYFTSSYKIININGKDVGTNELILTLNDQRIKQILKNILNDLQNDPKSIAILGKINNDSEGVVTTINDMISSLEQEQLLTKDLIIKLYSVAEETIKIEIINGNDKVVEYLNYTDNLTKIKEIVFYEKETVFLEVKFKQLSENDIAYEISFGEDEVFVNGTLSAVIKEVDKNKTWNNTILGGLSLSFSNVQVVTINVDLEATTIIGEQVDSINVNNVIKESDMTEEEQAEIGNKIMEKIYNALPSFLATEEDIDVF